MIILRQKNYARALLSKETFRNRMKSFYHNTGSALNRRISRTVGVTVGNPDYIVVKAAANVGQPLVGASMMSTNPMLGAAVAGAPLSYAYFPVAPKIKKAIKLPEFVPKVGGKTVAEVQANRTKKTFIKTKKALDKMGINENMRSLDTTAIGRSMAKVYKGGESIINKIKSGAGRTTNSILSHEAPLGNLALRPIHA